MATVYPGAYPPPAQGHVVVISQPGAVPPGTCPHCRTGRFKEEYTLIGILIALIFFPWGIICCLMMTERRCTNCNAKG